jgi:hypothetical protein
LLPTSRSPTSPINRASTCAAKRSRRLELDLLDRLGTERRAIEARVIIGTIELRAGRAYFNGRPLEDATAAELAEKCREGLTGGG